MASPSRQRERSTFGKYTLIGRLAKGGMGEICLARLEGVAGFEKLVVIKRVLRHLADHKRYVDMLLDEARIAARLSHPNICQVYELDEVDGEYYIAMEYLEGVSMSDLIHRMAKQKMLLDPRLIAAIITQACEGLHAAHGLVDRHGRPTNLVHRDISPSNVFITAAGPVKILDFGVAKIPDKLANTRTGAVKGKWSYMSPEQVLRQPLDRRSDIFSLGVVTFEALTGRRLFRRNSEYEICRAITETDAPAVDRYRPDLPDELSAVVARALARSHHQRFDTASQMSKAIVQSVAALGGPATLSEISEFVNGCFADEMAKRRTFVSRLETARGNIELNSSETLPIAPEVDTDTSVVSETRGTEIDRGSGEKPTVTSLLAASPNDRPERRRTAPTAPMRGRDQPGLYSHRPDDIQSTSPSPGKKTKRPLLRVLVAFMLVVAGLGVGAGLLYANLWSRQVPPTARIDIQGGVVVQEVEDAGAAEAGVTAETTKTSAVSAGPSPAERQVLSGAEPAAESKKKSRRRRARRLARERKRDPEAYYSKLVGNRRNALLACFDPYLRNRSEPPRKLYVVIEISRRGRVSSARIEPPAFDKTPEGRCLTQVVRQIDFGSHDDGIMVKIPLRPSVRKKT
ncbi:MAG: serine/threonine protein kinase [Proteobacteria bacterium]|nr:serine/threonine protein kinase [Pseudomonadota bacterium]